MFRKLAAGVIAVALAAFTPVPDPTVWIAPAATIEEDFTPTFNEAVASICAPTSPTRTLHLTKGEYHFRTPPAQIACALNIVGEGKSQTTLVRDYSGGVFLSWTRSPEGGDQSGGSIKAVTVAAGPGTKDGIAIQVQAKPDTNPNVNSFNRHSFIVDEVVIGRLTLDSHWWVGIYFDGSLNPEKNPLNPADNDGLARGIRAPFVTRTTINTTWGGCVYIYNGRDIDMNIECYGSLPSTVATLTNPAQSTVYQMYVSVYGNSHTVRLRPTKKSFWRNGDTEYKTCVIADSTVVLAVYPTGAPTGGC